MHETPLLLCPRHLRSSHLQRSVPPPIATACVCPHAFYLYHCYYQSTGCSPLLLHIRTLGRHSRNTVCPPQKYRVATCLHSVHPLLSSICGKPHTRVHETPLLLCCYVSPFGTPLALLDLFFCCRRANHVHTSVAPGTDPCLDRLNVSLQALTCVNKAPTSVPGKRQSLLHFGFPVSGFRFRVWGQGFVFQLQVPTNV